MRRRPVIPLFVASLVLCSLAGSTRAAAPEPNGYRMAPYDAPVPTTLEGASRVDAHDVLRLMREHDAIVIDVLPDVKRPHTLSDDALWLPVPHEGIAGSVWLPDIGYGELPLAVERYFRESLVRLTDADRERPLVFYCRMDCWMSWNAARRAVAWGYGAVHWFADGIDDWRFEDLPVTTLEPEPGRHEPSATSLGPGDATATNGRAPD